jgi:hypothetical protein
MKSTERLLSFTWLGLLSLGMSLPLHIGLNITSFTKLEHGFQPTAAFLLVWTFAAFSILITLWLLLPRAEQRWLGGDLQDLQRWNLASLSPLVLGLVSPLMLRNYLTSTDLSTRLQLMTTFIAAAFLLTKGGQYYRHLKRSGRLDAWVARFSRIPRRRRLLALFLAAFLIYHLGAAALVFQGLSFSGDEPYYLLTSHSLYQDQDINVADEYDDGEHTHFYPPELYPQVRLGVYARVGRLGTDFRYPINQPGISALILPWYALSQLFQGRVLILLIKSSLAFWTALLGLQIYLLTAQIWHREKISLGLWLIYSFTAPVFFYGFHIYPAIPIALFSVYIYRKAADHGPLPMRQYFLCGLLLALFPWFGLKYNMIFWPLLAVAAYHFIRHHKIGRRILWFLISPLAAITAFYFYVHALYGTFNPIAIYEGMLTAEKLQNFRDIMWHTPLMLRIDSFLDYFLDQRDGLLLYAPWYFFVLPGLIEMFRRARKTLLAFLLLAAPFLFNYAFFAHRQGGCPPGRVLAPLSWMGTVAVGYFLVHNRKRLYSLLFFTAAGLSGVLVLLLLHNPHFLYQPTTHEYTFRGAELFISLSNLHFYLPGWLPSFIKVNNLGYWPNFLWLGLIVLFGVVYATGIDLRPSRRLWVRTAAGLAGLAVLFLWFCFYPRAVLIYPHRVAYPGGEKLAFYALGRNVRMLDPGEFELTAADRTYTFYFTSWRRIDTLKLGFGPSRGEYSVKVELFDVPLFSGRMAEHMETLVYTHPPHYRYRNTHLYRLQLAIRRLTADSTTQNPFRLVISPRK